MDRVHLRDLFDGDVGLIAVFVWDALDFDRRDAMVLGPIPIRGRTIVAAKLMALGTLLELRRCRSI